MRKACWLLLFWSFMLPLEVLAKASEDWKILLCAARSCPGKLTKCLFDKHCRKTLNCNKKCGSEGSKAHQQACHLVCQLEKGKKISTYAKFVQCAAKNDCLPRLPKGTDGTCPVNPGNAHEVHILNDFEEIKGTWLEVRGRNCGKKGSKWEGGYDALPCRSSSWLFSNNQWWYHTSFCQPSPNNDCKGNKPVFLLAKPHLSESELGRLEVPYIDPPLKPQKERWYVLSKPTDHWMVYTYCGSTPVGEYAGLNIITRNPRPWETGIPAKVEEALRYDLNKFNINYDQMCASNHAKCPAVTAREDLEQSRTERFCPSSDIISSRLL